MLKYDKKQCLKISVIWSLDSIGVLIQYIKIVHDSLAN